MRMVSPCMDMFEWERRQRRDVCYGCGWDMVVFGKTKHRCVNSDCLGPSTAPPGASSKGLLKFMRHKPPRFARR